MKELSNLLGFRESIKVVDATLRDGGLVNDFYFTGLLCDGSVDPSGW